MLWLIAMWVQLCAGQTEDVPLKVLCIQRWGFGRRLDLEAL